MKNLFDYATKELSQDAFLRWVFENYQDEELSKVAGKLLTLFCEMSSDEAITDLHTTAQWNKIDISVWITTTKRKIALFIEDKTFSNEHNQLSIYNKHIDCITEYQSIYKVFYKSARIEQWEYQRINEVNSTSPIFWRTFDIKDIVNQLEEFASSSNIILSQYIEYVNKIYSALGNISKPEKNDTQIDYIKWRSYFEYLIDNELRNEFENDVEFYTLSANQYPYVCLGIKMRRYNKQVPYLEIRSRDCIDNKFSVKFLCYGMSEADIAQQSFLIDRIRRDSSFVCKNLKYRKRGKEIFPKQIGYSNLITVTNEEFAELIKKYTKEYIGLMKEWE